MRWLFLVFLALFDPHWAWAGSRFHERNHTGLLALYGFDDGQLSANLHPTSARDYTGRYLLGNLTASTTTITWSRTRAGFTVPSDWGGVRVISERNSTELARQLSDEVSVEIFLASTTNTWSDILVVGFGDWVPGAPFPRCDAEGTEPTEGGWRLISSLGNSLSYQARLGVISDETGLEASNCFEASLVTLPGTLRHSIMRVRPTELSLVTLDGGTDTTLGSSLKFRPDLWLQTPTHLTFASPQPRLGWKGTMYMIAIFDRYIFNDEAARNRVYGPPNSLPVATAADAPIATTEDITTTLYP